MTSRRPTTRRRILAGLTPVLIAAGALPLLAPTCGPGTEGMKTFARGSLVIPMDRCYQLQIDTASGSTPPAGCPQAADPGDVIKAYGLVYQLIRNDVPVYWVIEPTKSSLTGYDLAIQYDGGFPALLYDWDAAAASTPPTLAHKIAYMGGPFVVDGSDFAKASAVLQKYKATFRDVNVHVASVAFRGYAKKTLAGGWKAGGDRPPKIALLDIGSGELTRRTTQAVCTGPTDTTRNCDQNYCIGTVKNSQQVIEGYLTWAGIGATADCTPSATQTCPGGRATGPHGEIYDKLTMEDFQPEPGGDWTTTRFYRNSAMNRTDGAGYQLLWVPHWTAPGSCAAAPYNTSDDIRACACLYSRYGDPQIDNALRTIGAFVQAGNDLFAECSGLGSFEGVLDASGVPTVKFGDAVPETHFQTTTGMRINQKGVGAPHFWGSYASPLMQIGDYTFRPLDGAIKIYKPAGAYVPDPSSPSNTLVSRLVSDATDTSLDYFTLLPAKLDVANMPVRGSVVYLAGHSYNARQGTAQIGGSRLVLNTLFNLGAGCTESGVSCDTGQLGVCGQGVLMCESGQPTCVQARTATPEVCNGLDDDCDGEVDEELETACYDPDDDTRGKGLCADGIRVCEQRPDGTYGMSACLNQRRPSPELCNDLDDDCDGLVDEALQQACYTGPQTTLDASGVPLGSCKQGLQACSAGNWSECTVCPEPLPADPAALAACQILPRPEICVAGSEQLDENCDGVVNESTGEGCGACADGDVAGCYAGPPGTLRPEPSACRAGVQSCAGGSWTSCVGQVLPTPELCHPAGVDEDCDGEVDEGCGCTAPVDCYTGPPGTEGVGICAGGHQACVGGVATGACLGQQLPSTEICDGKDNDCSGVADENPDTLCTPGFTCVTGVCVPSGCGVERPCPEGFACSGAGRCERDVCGDGVLCEPGLACEFGACVDRCDPDPCGEGSFCADGACVGGSCYFEGCPAGQVCLGGACRSDACDGLTCPSGTFCRAGDCVQSCTFVSCPSGQKCGADGFCLADPCAGKSCAPAERCVAGACLADACAGVGCGQGQVCRELPGGGPACVDDPCTGVSCPVGRCLEGQCYAVGNAGVVGDGGGEAASGCGCTSAGAAAPLLALLGLLAAPLARRRRAGGGRGAALLVALAGLVILAGCKQGSTFDPSRCQTVCEGEERCVDVWTDPAHCGACGNACAASSVCVDRTCGPAGGVAPFITSLTRTSADQGDPAVVVGVNGLRLQAGATVRAVGASGTRTHEAALVGGRLEVVLDLTDAPAERLALRVVNPDRVISNEVAFVVTPPSPVITGVVVRPPAGGGPAPAAPVAGAVNVLEVSGTGFLPVSRCVLSHPTRLPRTYLETQVGAGALACTWDATVMQPAAGFQLTVENPAGDVLVASNAWTLALASREPVLNDLSPSSGRVGDLVAVTISGDGFDLTSQVLFDGAPVATTFVNAHQLYVAQLELPAAGAYLVSVRNGAAAPYHVSGTRPFLVGAAPPATLGLSQASAYQGDPAVAITVNGSALPPDTQLQLQPPGGTFGAGLPCTVNAGGTTATRTVSFVGQPAGFWLVRLFFPASQTSSASYAFRVLSSQAILQAASVRGEKQGLASVPVVLTASNLRPLATVPTPDKGVRVGFSGAAAPLVPSAVSASTVTVALSTVGLDTGTYTLQVANPDGPASPGGASPSNALSFTVSPGLPTLSSVCLAASPAGTCAASVRQQDTKVPVILRGTNFARPDATGAGGSRVHVMAPELGVDDYVVPAVDTLVRKLDPQDPASPTVIEVRLDTLAALPGRYDVQVWNPGGPQRSNVLVDAFEILP